MNDLLRRLDQALVPPLAKVLCPLTAGPARRKIFSSVSLTAAAVALVTVVMAARAPVPGRGQAIGEPVRVGITAGESVPAYAAAARAKLTTLGGGPAFALVSFAVYLAPDRLEHLLAGATPSRVYLRVPLPGVDTEVVPVEVRELPEDIVAGMEATARRREADAALAQQLAAKLTGNSPQERELRAAYVAQAQQAMAEATAYRRHCSCLYAAVVRAEPAVLTEVSRRPGVRAVDPTPGLGRLEQAVFVPPTPEQGAADPAVGVSPQPSPSRMFPSAVPSRRRPPVHSSPGTSPGVPTASPSSAPVSATVSPSLPVSGAPRPPSGR